MLVQAANARTLISMTRKSVRPSSSTSMADTTTHTTVIQSDASTGAVVVPPSHSEDESLYVYNFAFGANMASRCLTGRRKIVPLSSQPAVLHDYELNFNLRGVPYIEPCFGNVEHVPGSKVHGVLHKMTHKQFEHLMRTEAGSGTSNHGYIAQPVECVTYEGSKVTARVLQCMPGSEQHVTKEDMIREHLLPSKRYLTLLRDGAREHHLEPAYIEWLDTHPHAERHMHIALLWVFIGIAHLIALLPVFTLIALHHTLVLQHPRKIRATVFLVYLKSLWFYPHVVMPMLRGGVKQSAKSSSRKSTLMSTMKLSICTLLGGLSTVAAEHQPLRVDTHNSLLTTSTSTVKSLRESNPAAAYLVPGFRPPATPLIVHSPEVSSWSRSDTAYSGEVHHWANMPLNFSIAIAKAETAADVHTLLTSPNKHDDDALNFVIGNFNGWAGADRFDPSQQNLKQTSLQVLPTTTIYTFENQKDNYELLLEFTTPVFLTDDIEDAGVPHTFITATVRTLDGSNDDSYIGLLVAIGKSFVVEHPEQSSVKTVDYQEIHGVKYYSMENTQQNHYAYTCDFCKGDTGRLWLAAHTTEGAAQEDFVMISLELQPQSRPSNTVILAWDDIQSIRYFDEDLPPSWHRKEKDMQRNIRALLDNFSKSKQRANDFDLQLVKDFTAVDSAEYATLASLLYRQVTGSMKHTHREKSGEVMVFLKEISSDGDVSTVDVIFPAAPIFLYYNPQTLFELILPILQYSNNETTVAYPYPFAAHHLGVWPVCDIKPEQQENMPVEESSDIFLMLASVLKLTPEPKQLYKRLEPYWPMFDMWTAYLLESLPDPENQLCTDDFLGPSPHNTNLAVKGILGLYAYSLMLEGKPDYDKQVVADLRKQIKTFVHVWMERSDEDTHYRKQYDLPDSWSLKYNLVFQKILQIDVIPQHVIDTEISYYMQHALANGIPLDSQINNHGTKLDWLAWVAATSDDKSVRQQIHKMLYNTAHTTSTRVPLTDYYNAESADIIQFQARPVVGGVWATALAHKQEAALLARQ